MELLAQRQQVTRQCAATRADFHNALRVSFSRGGRDLRQNGLGGEEMLTELARQAPSVKHVATLMDRIRF